MKLSRKWLKPVRLAGRRLGSGYHRHLADPAGFNNCGRLCGKRSADGELESGGPAGTLDLSVPGILLWNAFPILISGGEA